jgi:hypothetical protein
MKRPLAFFAASLVFGHSFVAAASADCVSPSDRAPLRTAAMQQELMVAALQCHDVNEYNRFVLSHQSELISSDRALEAYFQRAGQAHGTATYNKYKTELANAASLRSSQNPGGFCGAAGRLFDQALRPMSLSEIVADVALPSDRAIANCPVLADNAPTAAPPVRTAPEVPYAYQPNPAPGWDAGEDNGQSLDSQVRNERGAAPYGPYDDDPDE